MHFTGPLYLLLITAIGLVFFKEKVNKSQMIGIGLIVLALVLLNL